MPFGAEAAAAASEIHQICFNKDGWSADSIKATLATAGAYGLMHEKAGFVIYSCFPPQSEIITIAVLPEFRRNGIGRGLMQAAMAAAKSFGAEQMFLEVACNNKAAIALYRSLGFKDGIIRPQYYADGCDALCMAVSL